MCGIVGIIDFSHQIEIEELNRFTDSLEHRGPDGRGTWSSHGRYGLGHRRLSILDLSTNAACPYHYKAPNGKDYVLVYNGEIYNFIEIANELKQLGHRFRTTSDTEVLVAAFAEWGPACLMRLNGMWAFAIVSLHDHSVFLARDRFGVKPLYYSIQGNALYFASEQKAFLSLNKFELRMNETAISGFLKNSQAFEGSTDETLLLNVRKIMPGTLMTISREGQIHNSKWWNTADHIQAPEKNLKDRINKFRELFLDACRIRLRSDVKIACSFSGGIDSTAVAASIYHLRESAEYSLERTSDEGPTGYLSRFPGEPNDETEIARHAAIAIGMPLVESTFNDSYGLDDLFRSVWVMEDPYPTIAVPVIDNYGAIKQDQIKVSIDGHGGDELLCGYAFYLNSPIGQLNQVLYHQFHAGLLPSILRNYDRCSMHNGIEVRMPFMDYRLVTYSFGLSPTDKASQSFTKFILREALQGIMPEKIRTRRSKIGFNAPLVTLFNNKLANLYHLISATRIWNDNPWWNSKEVSSKVTELVRTRGWKQEHSSDAADLWLKLNLCMWHMLFIERSFRI